MTNEVRILAACLAHVAFAVNRVDLRIYEAREVRNCAIAFSAKRSIRTRTRLFIIYINSMGLYIGNVRMDTCERCGV